MSAPATFATPNATSSWSGSTESPRRAANVREMTLVSVNAMRAIPSAPGTSASTSERLTVGIPLAANPRGTAPTTASWFASPRTVTTSAARTTAMRIPGRRREKRRRTSVTTSAPPPITSATGTTRPSTTPRTIPIDSPRKSEPSTENPSSFGTWLTITVSAMPLMYPTRTGRDSRSVRKPRRAAAAPTQIAPTMSASAEARATERPASPPASGMIVAAMGAISAESGPSTRIRDGPTRKYATSGPTVAYRPVIAGRPAACAYAIPAGTRSADRTIPATRSARNEAGP
jgi:hypothetical protein